MKRLNRIRFVIGLVIFISIISMCVAAGHWIASSYLEVNALWHTMFSLWIGIAIFAILALGVFSMSAGIRKREDADQYAIMLDALSRISQGDFTVFLVTDDHMHVEFVEAINTMARNLGNMESMRQDFISNVSHEIQSPLTSISGFATLLKKSDLPLEERLRYAEIIGAESKRLSSLSENLLKLSTLDHNPIRKETLRLDQQLSSIILTLEPLWMSKQLIVEADLPRCALEGDEDLLSQVWMNLLVNAIKFTPAGGTIFVSLRDHKVTITDTGIGISSEDIPHIFERFYKVDKSRDRSLGGNGLGLSLVKKIIELHNGTVEVHSELYVGTAFTIVLP